MKPALPPLAFLVAAALQLAGAIPASAQVGLPFGELHRQYGIPARIDTNAAGIQTFLFRKNRLDITALGKDDRVLRMICHKIGLDGRDVGQLLEANRGNAGWAPLTSPGGAGEAASPVAWLRSDDKAMAALDGTTLTITAGAWNLLPPAETPPAPSAGGPAVPPASATAPPASAPAPPAPVPARPSRPGRLPLAGDTRNRVLDLLGPPRGAIASGPHEILQYAWGQILLAQGKVTRVD